MSASTGCIADGVVKLLQAAQQGDIHTFKECIDSADTEKSWKTYFHKRSGDTVLSYACRHGHLDILMFLLEEEGFDLEQANFDGKRPLHEAAQAGHTHCVEYLLHRGANVDSLKRADWTALMLACTKDNLTVIQRLVDAGADVTLRNKDGWNCFHIACREGHADIIHYLLDKSPTLWDTVSNNGRTPLHTSALHGHKEVTEILLETGHYVTDSQDSCGTTPLMDAVRAGFTDIASLLIAKHKASITATDNLGRQPIHLAAQAGSLCTVCHLVEQYGVNVNTPSVVSAVTPLHLAAKEGQNQVLEQLLLCGADVHRKDNKGRTALHLASGSQHATSVYTLLKHGATDCTDLAGNTASDMATQPQVKQQFVHKASLVH